MNKKTVSGIMLTLLLIGLLSLSFNIRQVEASGTIYIMADGSVDPPTAPIHSVDNITYVFTDNIYDEIVVERNSIVLDGAGYTIQGTGSGNGIYLYDRRGVIIKNAIINEWQYGIAVYWSSNNAILGNTMTNNYVAIKLDGARSNTISGNTMTSNNVGVGAGSDTQYSYNDTISRNIFLANNVGMGLWYTTHDTIIGNNLTNNQGPGIGIVFGGRNTVCSNTVTNSDAGIVLLVSSGNIIYNNTIINNGYGFDFWSSGGTVIYHNDIINNTIQSRDDTKASNDWHHPDLLEGNYWSDYTGADDGSGVGKHAIADDGIGDTLIPHPDVDCDFYPLMEPWTLKPPEGDLSISSLGIRFSDPNPSEGQTITISATVHNFGEGNIENVTVQFFDANTPIGEERISFISHHSHGTASIDWTAGGEGFHLIKVVVDPYNSIAESDEENNEATRSILVGEILHVGGIVLNGSVTPNETHTGCLVTVQGYAEYNTTFGAGEPVAGAEVTITIAGWEQETTHTIKDGTYEKDVVAPHELGNYIIIVTVTDFTFSESIEIGLVVTQETGVDLTLSHHDISFSPPDPIEYENVNITATIHNVGTENATNILIAFYDDGEPIGNRIIDLIVGGGSEDTTISWNATPWGWHTIRVVTDPQNTIVELNEDNNDASKGKRVYPALPDLTPTNIDFSDSTAGVNQTITISADVQNIGGVNASNVLVSFCDDGQLIGNTTIPGIPGKDESRTASKDYAFATDGLHKICVYVDPANDIPEADEENNQYCAGISIHLPLPDLTLSRADITFSDSAPTIGDIITIYATIHNIGETNAHNVIVELFDGDTRINHTTIPSINASGQETVDVSWNATPVGWHRVKVIIDGNNTIAESNENNNMATRYIYVYPKVAADLCIYSEDIVFSNTNPMPGENVTIYATIHNIGEAEAQIVTVIFYIDDIQLGSPQTIPSLPVGGNETVSTKWIASQVGSHVVKVVVDTPIESDKNNNVATRAIIVRAPAQAPELYIRTRGAHGTSGVWPEWHVGLSNWTQTLNCRILNYATMGAWVEVEFIVRSELNGIQGFTSNQAWIEPATWVEDDIVPAEVTVSASFPPGIVGKYWVYGILYFKSGEMAEKEPYYLYEEALGGEGLSRDINVAFKVQEHL